MVLSCLGLLSVQNCYSLCLTEKMGIGYWTTFFMQLKLTQSIHLNSCTELIVLVRP